MGKAPDQGKVAIVNSASGVAPTHGGRRPRAYNGGMQKAIDYDELNDALARIGHVDDAAEYHGALCGALCVAKPEQIDRESTRLNSSHSCASRMPSSA